MCILQYTYTDNHNPIYHLIELGLYGRRMNALVVEKLLDQIGETRVLGEILAADMSRGNDAVTCQLPYVQLVNFQHTLDLSGVKVESTN